MHRVAVLSADVAVDDAPGWVRHHWRAMGSTAEVVLHAPRGERVLAAAVSEVARLEGCWSRFDERSELTALNDSAGHWFTATPTLWDAVRAAADAWERTGGRFDPTVLRRLEALGYDRSFRLVSPDGTVDPEVLDVRVCDFAAVDLDARHRRVRLPSGVGLDLGGIGKGLAADRVADLVAAEGGSVAVSLGGDIAVRGPAGTEDGAWHVPVVDPESGEELGSFPLVDEALVQSTTVFRRWRRNGHDLHHLIDPRTGWPAGAGVVTAVVTGPEAGFAEALAKAAIVAGPLDGLSLLDELAHDGWLRTEEGVLLATKAVARDLLGQARAR